MVGSRGDVQPFIALGCALLKHGHRVRLATHTVFGDFVVEAGLEFFSIGGNPHELMSYMVKSLSTLLIPLRSSCSRMHADPGLIPGMESLRNGDIGKKRRMLGEVRFWYLYMSTRHSDGFSDA